MTDADRRKLPHCVRCKLRTDKPTLIQAWDHLAHRLPTENVHFWTEFDRVCLDLIRLEYNRLQVVAFRQ
jgi:hypothetical protein